MSEERRFDLAFWWIQNFAFKPEDSSYFAENWDRAFSFADAALIAEGEK